MKNHSLLDQILKPGGLRSLFQPIVELGPDGEILHSLECLSRGPRGTNVEAANLLFDYARLKGEEARVDRACIETALRCAATLPMIPRLSLNVHATTLTTDDTFAGFLAGAAEEHGLSPTWFTVEIVEHSPALCSDTLRRSIGRLRELGVRIALDDVGHGYSSYQMILESQPDYFKVDRSLVAGCDHHVVRLAILQSLLYLAERLGARVVAEGVECRAELEALTDLGFNLFQGYYFARPMPSEKLAEHPLMAQVSERPQRLAALSA